MCERKIKVLYDDGGFLMPHGGVPRYFTEVIKRLPAYVEWKLGMVGTSNCYLMSPPFNIPPHQQTVNDFIKEYLHGHSFRGVSHVYRILARLMPIKFPSGELANKRRFKKECLKGDFDILHITHPHPVDRYWKNIVGKKPIVATVHDLIPEMMQANRIVAKCRMQMLHDATKVIAVSENTKKDIIRLYGIEEDKIKVIHHGYLSDRQTNIINEAPNKPYILYVGKRKGYKNFDFFVGAIASLLIERDMILFCTGSAFSDEEMGLIEKYGIADRVINRFVSDGEMSSLFKNAVAFVYPSLYEGFGIPILDAFNAGCPVVLSRCSCFPEVAGDAALYFDKGDGLSLCEHIERVFDDKVVRNQMIERGKNRVLKYSWENCAEATAYLYEEAMAE